MAAGANALRDQKKKTDTRVILILGDVRKTEVYYESEAIVYIDIDGGASYGLSASYGCESGGNVYRKAFYPWR